MQKMWRGSKLSEPVTFEIIASTIVLILFLSTIGIFLVKRGKQL